MEHPQSLPADVLGENLSWGDSPTVAAQLWYGEKGHYSKVVRSGKECTPSHLSMAQYGKCGHYANVVDPRVTRVGCGMAGPYLTCRYG